MTTYPITFTNPIYHEGPLAQAITAFHQQQEQARAQLEQDHAAKQQGEVENMISLLSLAEKQFGDLFYIFKPYITGTSSNWEHKIDIDVAMPEVWPFQIHVNRTGWSRVTFPYSTNLEKIEFGASVSLERFARVILEGHQYWLCKEAERQTQEQLKAKKIAYAQAWDDYNRERISTLAKNEMALALLQEEYKTPFSVWRLTYGITAYHDDEGEFYADTRGVWVLNPDPDEDGFFPVIDDTGKVTHRKYYSLVYLDGPQTFHAEPGSTYCGHIHVKEANASLYFSPLLNYAKVLTRVQSFVEANMHPLPKFPHYGDFGLDERPNRYEMEDLERELTSEGEEEIPF